MSARWWSMTSVVALLLLGGAGLSPLFLLPGLRGALVVIAFLPFFFGVGLPVTVSCLRLDGRDVLFVPMSILSGILLAGTAHLALLHLGGRALTPFLVVGAGTLALFAHRHALGTVAPRPSLLKTLLVLGVLFPQLARVQFRSWSRLVGPDGGLVNYFNGTQSFNIGMIRDVAGGIPIQSSFIYPLVGTYHVGGHALADLFRALAPLTPFEATFIVLNLFVVGLGEVALLWLIGRWFCQSFWSRLLWLSALVYLSGDAVRVLLVRVGFITDRWAFGGDEAEIFSFPYISTNVPRTVSLLVALWLVYVVLERMRQDRPLGVGPSVGLGVLFGSVYYYKNLAFLALLPGLFLVAANRARWERRMDLCVVMGTATLTGLVIHALVFSYGGSYGLGVPLQLIRSWGIGGGPLALALLAYLAGLNFRLAGAVALGAAWRELRQDRLLMSAALWLIGTVGAGFFLSNFLTHAVGPDIRVPEDSPFHRFLAPGAGGYSVYNLALRQFIHIPHAFLSVFLLGFLARWIEAGVRKGAWSSWSVAGCLGLLVLGGVSAAPRAFPYGQKPPLADPDLRAALATIPRENTLTEANFLNYSLVSLEGHRFHHQFTAFFNQRAFLETLRRRADNQYRLFLPETGEAEKRRILAEMKVTHLLISKEAGGATEVPGCRVYYDNRRYSVCRTGS